VKNGCTVYHANAGKKIIGTASPGNNSGFLISNGRDIEIGIITAANERIEYRKLKIISPVLFNQYIITQFIKQAITETPIFKLMILTGFKIAEKFISVAK